MKIPMLNPTATPPWTLAAALLLSLLWPAAPAKAGEPVPPPKEAAAEREVGEDTSPNQAEGIPADADQDEPQNDTRLSKASATSQLTAAPDDRGETGEKRDLDEIGKYEQQTVDMPTSQPASAPRQQALVTFPPPLRLNTTPNSGGIFRWPKGLRTDPDEDPPIAPAAASKSLFSQSGAAARVKPPMAKPKALLPPGLFSSSGAAGGAAMNATSSASNRRSPQSVNSNPQSAKPAEIKRSKALFNGSLFSVIEPEQTSATTTAGAQPPKALLPLTTMANSQNSTVPAAISPAPQSRALLSGSSVAGGPSAAVVPNSTAPNSTSPPTAPQTRALLSGPMFTGGQPSTSVPIRLPPANEQSKALFSGSPFANGQFTLVGNAQPASTAPASLPSAGNQPKALFSGTFLAKRVAPSSVEGAPPIAATAETPRSKALFPVLGKSAPIPAFAPVISGVPTLAVPKLAPTPIQQPAEEVYDTELARSMMKGTMPVLDDAQARSGSGSSRRPGRQLPDEAHEPVADDVVPTEQTAAPKSPEEPAVAESKSGAWRSKAVTDERRSLAESPTFKISKPPGMVLKQWTLADSAALDKSLKPIPAKATKKEKAIVIPVVREKSAIARSSADEATSIVQAANAQEPDYSAERADKPESSSEASSLTIVPRESERATQLNPTPAPAKTSHFRKNPLR